MKTVRGRTSKAASAARPSVRSSWPGLQTLAKASPDLPGAAGIQCREAAAERGALGALPQPQGCASAGRPGASTVWQLLRLRGSSWPRRPRPWARMQRWACAQGWGGSEGARGRRWRNMRAEGARAPGGVRGAAGPTTSRVTAGH